MQVTKRDGRVVDFDRGKIRDAILKAFIDVDGVASQYAKTKASDIAAEIEKAGIDDVEKIQDEIERKLMNSNRKDVARRYISYRNDRTRARERNLAWMKTIKEKIAATNVQNQNANVDERSFGGRKGEADSELMRKIALDELMCEKSRNHHLNNEIYEHDLDWYAVGGHNCLTIPFDKLLAEGFNTRQTDVRPAQSVNTAFQLIAVIFQLQSLQQFGGVSASHIDHTMVPYVRKSFKKYFKDGARFIAAVDTEMEKILESEKEIGFETPGLKEKYPKVYEYAYAMTEKEVKQGAEGLLHNLNTLQSRSGNQLPFTSINYGTCTLPEGRMVIKALLGASINGVGKLHKTPIFPCSIWQCMKGVNREPGDPNYDLYRLALESTSKRLYPNYVNVDWSINAGYDKNDPKTYVSTINTPVA